MSVVNQLASRLNRNDEEPNIELAHTLANEENHAGIEEIIENLSSKDKKVQHDCIKVAYEIGQVKPELIRKYAQTFIELLKSRNNRLVWGGMTALSTITEESSETIMAHLHTIKSAMKIGSVITIDKGVLTLAKLAAVSKENNDVIFPFLLEHLENCRTKEVPQHSESTMLAVTDENREGFLNVLRKREPYLSAPQLKRVKKIYKTLEA
ncbi:hypothetical protein [Rossellomorea aquimaris]|jgi:hypothetical protein|uniref:HEAT repeat domain-containing protein n=1 Tax=Rossellomorea aquimaris TaxID=189382 RepID=A0A5D4UJH0_9BACI|nr:hypothetical protein [Rossellomorea aquimaris]TYS75691.1 hypothetical protein FZD05_20315 [Rossellomorea aquimaris]TYS87261.1 hypothetical protein FZC85_09855 [Rossellomorea aquimaris]